jgi:hypothetical protein
MSQGVEGMRMTYLETKLQGMWKKRDYEGIIRALRKRYPRINEGALIEENQAIPPKEYLYYDLSVTRARRYVF